MYENQVGVVHYSYQANVASMYSFSPSSVTGKWTEIHTKQEGEWILIAVSGRPDIHQKDQDLQVYKGSKMPGT